DAGDDRDQVDEGVADDDDQNDERRDERQTQGDSLHPMAADGAQQPVVLLRRDPVRVVRAAAPLAAPALPVGDVPRFAALALDRDRGPAHPESIVRAPVATIETVRNRCYFRNLARLGPGGRRTTKGR